MKGRQQRLNMKQQTLAIVLGLAFTLAATGVSHAKSELASMSQEPLWPASSTPDGTLVYDITTVSRAGSGVLTVTLTAGALPPGATATFVPSVLRFRGNRVESQTARMIVTCPGMIPLDCFPYTITGTSAHDSLTITNHVICSMAEIMARVPTLYLDKLAGTSLRLRGLGASGGGYNIMATANLANPVWVPLGSASADANGRFTFLTEQPGGGTARFFKVVSK
jgi:hypothetical protein